MRVFNSTVYNLTNNSYTRTSDPISLENMIGYMYASSFTVASLSNPTFVDGDVSVANDTITKAAHGLITGQAFTLTTTGVLPGGLSLATTYYAIVDSSSVFKVASSLANALAGTAVDITSAAGGGTHTVAKTALSGASLKVQFSLDYDPNFPATGVWFDLTSGSDNITGGAGNDVISGGLGDDRLTG
jgi:Ca2+-binding RTX toxin-like protein